MRSYIHLVLQNLSQDFKVYDIEYLRIKLQGYSDKSAYENIK